MKRIALLFSGQGAQHVGMGKDLASFSPEIASMYKDADKTINLPLSQACFEGPETALTETAYCQPALYLHGVALLKVLKQKLPHFQYEACAGLSLGEFTAHAAAGTYTWQDGLVLVGHRGRLMQEACDRTDGSMLSLLGATEPDAQGLAKRHNLEVANLNCPGQIVLSGEINCIEAASTDFNMFPSIKRAIPLKVAGAYHSRLMAHAQAGLEPFIAQTTMQLSATKVTSNVTGNIVTSVDEVRSVLLKQVTGSVRWENCIRTLMASGITHFIELGPGKVLAGLCKRIDKNISCATAGNLQELEALTHEFK